jgi:hypothetical protein
MFVSKADALQHMPATCQDEELDKLKEKVTTENAENAKIEETTILAQLKQGEVRALADKLEKDPYAYPDCMIEEHFKGQRRYKQTPIKTMVEEVIAVGPAESQIDDVTQLVYQLVLDDKIREANMKRADEVTINLVDLRLDKQPMNVFQRMWTPVSLENPIWRHYRHLFRDLKQKREKGHQELAACSRCMTVFFPFFPDYHHLHKRSKMFSTAVDDRRVNSCLKAMVEAPDDRGIYESSTYQALVGLAKEAKAYKKDSTGEYIKLILLANATRSHRGKGKYEHAELCENCEVEFDLKEEARKRFKVQNLAAGILELIFM